jgi:choline dehydrogenase
LDTQHDIDVLVRALKIMRRIARSNPLAQSIDPEGLKDQRFDHHLFDASDAELVKYVRERVQTLYHPTSTARMSSLEDGGVVDGRLRVYGVQGLRIVDASIFPTLVVYFDARKCTDSNPESCRDTL